MYVYIYERTVSIYITIHLLFLPTTGTGQSTALMASSKTFFNPFWVRAEHSRYLTAWISFAI